ncbi:MAG: phosphoribosylformylglycinamidine synthase subunit PurL, partial [Verrucomicrobia bacterium]|nr:phosphoribosylformylglycinamidine synthase subunit PurL [Cytophagales bacterium]
LIAGKLVVSAHDCSDGGIFVALAESAMAGNLGFEIQTDNNFRKDAFLFGENQSRVIVSVRPDMQASFEAQAGNFQLLGKVTASEFIVDNQLLMNVSAAKNLYDHALGHLIGG